MDDAEKPVKHNMEKVAQLHVINVLFYLGETTGIHNFGLSLPRLQNAGGCCGFCRNRKMPCSVTLRFSGSEIHAKHREEQTASKSRGEWETTFRPVRMTHDICHCILNQLLLRIILRFFLSDIEHRFCIHKNHNKSNVLQQSQHSCVRV